ncbi:MAG TPA: hypothetical protein VIM55_11540 [Mucilaginibacter sp.]
MKSITKTTTLIIIAIIFVSLQAFGQNPDLSGFWNRNNTKSDVGGTSFNNIPRTVEIKQDKATISIKRTAVNAAGVTSSYTEVIKLNGDSSETMTPSKLIRKSSAEWESQVLVINSVSKDASGMIQQKARQSFSLDNGGKTLKIDAVQTYSGREIHLIEVFDKQ